MNKNTKIIWRNIDELKPYEHNAKIHNEKQVKNIALSLKTYGWQAPILIDENDVIIYGHGRVLGAKEAGITTAPTIVCDDLNEEQIKNYRHLDNLLSEGDYDAEQFKIDLPDLSGFDFSGIDVNLDFDNGTEYTVPEAKEIEFDDSEEKTTVCPNCGLRFVPMVD